MTPLIAGLAILVAAPGTKDPPKKEPASLVGVWNIDTVVKGGKPISESRGSMEFTADGKIMLKEAGKEIPLTYSADTKKSPAELDIDFPSGGNGDSLKLRGIFMIDGDLMTLCLGHVGDRPSKFESTDGSMSVLLTLKRAKKD
jgi:uncharacterized protein (TIGR03067 family)